MRLSVANRLCFTQEMLLSIFANIIMNFKKQDISRCNSAGCKFEVCAKDVAAHDQVVPTLSVFGLAGMTYQRGSKSKVTGNQLNFI